LEAGDGARADIGVTAMTDKKVLLVALAFALVASWSIIVPVLTAEDKADKEEFTLVGVKKCKMCHNKEATGKQYAIWAEGAHAKAFETLAGEKALAHAKEAGLGNPQEEPKCLQCHVTAFPVMEDLENQKITMEEGISCESCHGPGSGYDSKKVKKAVQAEEITAESVGLLAVTEETCLGCHNEDNPFHKEFVYEERIKKVSHPLPKEEE
jgi:hypothetical protein